ncbi:DUF4236 domain-containing protein [Tunturiibacter lichenicola]|uniref:DUF4236 domain-containing protein n=1 Tax=Tunturiibacter lichenicola TaxID=2051959 RepID=UPI0021B4D1C4|nr:DUF4236 domain-containing protein [Edaphobacter lichenicola]
MGFGFRKSFGSGPFRFTVSPSGISSSFGVKGARVTSGHRGTFVTVSSNGFYYRQRVETANPSARTFVGTDQSIEQPIIDSVFQVPVAELISSNQNELIEKLNANASARNPGVLFALLSILGFFAFPSFPTKGILLVSTGLILSAIISYRFKLAHQHWIHYSLDDEATKKYFRVQDAISTLGSCARVWTLDTQISTGDVKRNAGATKLITRKLASVGATTTKGLAASIPFKSISSNGTVFHFLPDQILVFSGGRYASVNYSHLNISSFATRFVENEQVPGDSIQVDSTWQYVNKKGGPDRRFNNNRQLPILQYGEITLRTSEGLNVVLQTSNYEKAELFRSQLRDHVQTAVPNQQQSSGSKCPSRIQTEDTLLRCYDLLAIKRPSTLEQATLAHRQQAALYHPDKYEHLAPEMKVLASARMQEINEAYTRVRLDIAGA